MGEGSDFAHLSILVLNNLKEISSAPLAICSVGMVSHSPLRAG